ncbi:MAG: YIP1 family protein [Bacteroidota bacterium]
MSESIAVNINEREEFTLKNWHLFVFITGLYLIITLINDKFIMTRDVYSLLLSDKIESNRIDDYYEMLKRFSVYTYLALPLLTWLKITFIALLLQTPLMLKSVEVSFKETFRIAAFANAPYIILGFVKLIILFVTPKTNYTNNLLTSIPGSITNLISMESYSSVAYKFLSSINIYEILWVLIVFYGLAKLKKMNKADSFILAFSIWLGLTLFQVALVLYFNKA